MTLGDVSAIVFLVIAMLIAMPCITVMFGVFAPRLASRAEARVARHPVLTFLAGLPATGFVLALAGGLRSAPAPAAKFVAAVIDLAGDSRRSPDWEASTGAIGRATSRRPSAGGAPWSGAASSAISRASSRASDGSTSTRSPASAAWAPPPSRSSPSAPRGPSRRPNPRRTSPWPSRPTRSRVPKRFRTGEPPRLHQGWRRGRRASRRGMRQGPRETRRLARGGRDSRRLPGRRGSGNRRPLPPPEPRRVRAVAGGSRARVEARRGRLDRGS